MHAGTASIISSSATLYDQAPQPPRHHSPGRVFHLPTPEVQFLDSLAVMVDVGVGTATKSSRTGLDVATAGLSLSK